ncbi:hypothetical protein [Streptomyces sp. NPDC048357]|uniref:hypothetical protein n=1 Tax=Streptomyces sp. NPDC048357 TaxID=3154719 RepID=UPI00341965E9
MLQVEDVLVAQEVSGGVLGAGGVVAVEVGGGVGEELGCQWPVFVAEGEGDRGSRRAMSSCVSRSPVSQPPPWKNTTVGTGLSAAGR